MADQPGDAVDVLRAVWAAGGQELPDTDARAKPCRNMRDFSFDGMAEPGTDLGDAWRDRLRREGKLGPSGGGVRDLVLGPGETS